MALAPVVDSIDSLPETVRGAYEEKDGKFHLNLEKLDIPDVGGLKTALEAERKAAKEFKSKAAAWERLGVSPDEIESRIAAEQAKAQEAALKAGKFDEVLQTHLGKAKLERDEAVGKASKERDSALNVAKSAIVNTSLATALVKEKATATGQTALPKLIGDRVKIEFDENGAAKATIYEEDGKTPMVGGGPGGLATFDDLVKETKKQFPDLFEGSGAGSGTGPNSQRRDAGSKVMTRSDFMALDPQGRMSKIKEGFKIVD